jgi:hypothetical protein
MKATEIRIPSVVKYNNKYYVLFNKTSEGRAKLLSSTGLIYSGTPMLEKLTFVKELPYTKYNGHWYVLTKQGIFSCSTGKFTLYAPIVKRFLTRFNSSHLAKLFNNKWFKRNVNVYNGKIA